ncbi:AkeP protein [Colletotrichum navitas]|uniref:AkeP protein n=1 Tax=Colletotrichum navitas TaxID=681940 RepID=A0AAD8PWE3_9PEZI|nr:AkeP protein [Colletotrichum navitas]KAK1585478.1 AkeP protein [Colletotrichum navitas]
MLTKSAASNILLGLVGPALCQLDAVPSGFDTDRWASVSNEEPLLAVIPGQSNRSVFDAPSAAQVSDSGVAAMLVSLITPTWRGKNFVAYDERFFDIIGPNATVEQLQVLPFQVHEAACYIPEQSLLFFVEWGPPPEGGNGAHDWQYILDVRTNNLTKIRTNPLTYNVLGCVYQIGKLHVVTGGGPNETAYLATIDPTTWGRKTVLNNFYERPFMSFNEIEMDRGGNYYLTDSDSGWGRDLNPFGRPTLPALYFVNGTTLRIKELALLEGNTNGVSLSPDGKTLFLSDTSALEVKPSRRNPLGDRDLWAFDFAVSSSAARLPLLTNKWLLSHPMQYIYDGVRVSNSGLIFSASGEVVDVLDPESGWTLGSIGVGGGGNNPVNLAFHENEIFIVGKGGVWHVKNVRETLK